MFVYFFHFHSISTELVNVHVLVSLYHWLKSYRTEWLFAVRCLLGLLLSCDVRYLLGLLQGKSFKSNISALQLFPSIRKLLGGCLLFAVLCLLGLLLSCAVCYLLGLLQGKSMKSNISALQLFPPIRKLLDGCSLFPHSAEGYKPAVHSHRLLSYFHHSGIWDPVLGYSLAFNVRFASLPSATWLQFTCITLVGYWVCQFWVC